MEIDPSLPDRHVGSLLSVEEVESLRKAIGWLRENRGLRLKDLALGCDSAEHTIRMRSMPWRNWSTLKCPAAKFAKNKPKTRPSQSSWK